MHKQSRNLIIFSVLLLAAYAGLGFYFTTKTTPHTSPLNQGYQGFHKEPMMWLDVKCQGDVNAYP